MSQSIAEIVSDIEALIALGDDEWQMDNSDFEALIASWRERGEALKEARGFIAPTAFTKKILHRIDAALKAAGEK